MLRKLFGITALFAGIASGAAPAAMADPPWRNCQEAHADYRYNIPAHDPGYHEGLDADGNGWACEAHWGLLH